MWVILLSTLETKKTKSDDFPNEGSSFYQYDAYVYGT